MPQGSRLALWCLALLFTLSLYSKGRVPTVTGAGAAFLRAGDGIVVRLAGDFPSPGLYRLPAGATADTVIKMTLAKGAFSGTFPADAARVLASGEILTLRLAPGRPAELSRHGMRAPERMLLGIPLDPDLLEGDEWSALPGIGPALSARIAADRQKYGAFGSLDGLLRVPGVGPGRLAAIRRYF